MHEKGRKVLKSSKVEIGLPFGMIRKAEVMMAGGRDHLIRSILKFFNLSNTFKNKEGGSR